MFGVCGEESDTGICELGTWWSLIGSIDPVTRRILVVFPFAPLVVGGGILGVVFRNFVEVMSLPVIGFVYY